MRRAPSTPPELPGFSPVRLLGAGGFADVFLYEQQLPRRKVAVKVLLTDHLSAASREAFVAEANVMAQLSTHPYIVTIHHAGVAADGRPYLVMEYCPGASLGERYKSESFAVADALRTGVRLAGAVATAHAAGILHRDIKPANVLGNDYGWPALTDFGISSALDDDLPVHTTTLNRDGDTGTGGTGASIGMSVPWSPPEMFADEPQPDARSDVFSLAATIYTLLAGHTPFEIRGRSNGTLDLIGRIERGVITPISRDDVPASLIAVLRRGMATRRRDRYASAVEFARALQRVELELGYAPTTIEVPHLGAVPAGRAGHGGDDETRLRSVATVQAQAPLQVSPPAPLREPPSPAGAEATVVRSVAVVEQKAAEQDSAEQEEIEPGTVVRRPGTAADEGAAHTEVSTRRRSRAMTLATTAAALGLAAVIAASLMLSGAGVRTAPGPSEVPGAPDDPIVGQAVPTPVFESAEPAADGTSVTFRWSNPAPEDGDSYSWARAEQPNAATRVPEPNAAVELGPSGRVCVLVSIVRSGRTSAEPLEACYPE